jgi:alkylation response protein AidB-like acyl-CoA dehydrogenase
VTLPAAARDLVAELGTYRAEHDRDKQLSASTVRSLRDHGFLGCLLPSVLGGAELEPAAYVATLEALAEGDAATGWVAMTASTSTMLAAYLPRATAALLWGSGAPLVAGVFAPGGTIAGGIDGERRLSGRWSWASGSRHADWFALGAMFEGKHLVCFVPRANVRIIENWDTLGLAGTGSHDLEVTNAPVIADHTCSVFAPPWATTPLYRVPVFGLLAVGIASCALGIAKAALGHAAARLTREAEPPSPQVARYAELFAELAAARAYLIATCTSVFARIAHAPVDPAARGELRLAASHVTHRCAEVVRACFHIDGGAAVRAHHPLQLALRDIEMVMTHKMVVDRVLPAAGRALLGLGKPPPDL